MKNSNLKIIVLSSFSLILGLKSFGQNHSSDTAKYPAQIPPVAGANRVFLMNKSTDTQTVYLSYDSKSWYPEKLIPRAVTPYRMNNNIYIKVFTSNTVFVQYSLEKSCSYSLEYNDKAGKWDVYKIEHTGP